MLDEQVELKAPFKTLRQEIVSIIRVLRVSDLQRFNSSTSKDAIRGQEQRLIDQYGGAKSSGGTSGNAINGVSPQNPNAEKYRQAAQTEFGEL